MSHCPSHDWDRYLDLQEPAEECPQCGEPNFDEETEEPVFPGEPDFCSQACVDAWTAQEAAAAQAEDEADAAWWAEHGEALQREAEADEESAEAFWRDEIHTGAIVGSAQSRSQAEQAESGPETRNETREPSEEPSEPTCSGCGGSGVDPDPGPNNHGCPPACPRCEGCGDEQACLDRLFGPGSP